jgi:maltooligosyltrehalose trehalohydrolase
LYFTDYEGDLAEAVKSGRRKEFGKFPEFSTPEAQRRIPDPNRRETFDSSRPAFESDEEWSRDWRDFYRKLLDLRHQIIVPVLEGVRADGAQAIGARALQARWILGDRSTLTLAANFGSEAVQTDASPGETFFTLGAQAEANRLEANSFRAILLKST